MIWLLVTLAVLVLALALFVGCRWIDAVVADLESGLARTTGWEEKR